MMSTRLPTRLMPLLLVAGVALGGCSDEPAGLDPSFGDAAVLHGAPAYTVATSTALNQQIQDAVVRLYNFNNDLYGFYNGAYILGGGEAFYEFASEANLFLTAITLAGAGPVPADSVIARLERYKAFVAQGRSGTLRLQLEQGGFDTRVWLSACAAAKLTQGASNIQAMVQFAVANPTVGTYALSPLTSCPEVVSLSLTASAASVPVGSSITITPRPLDLGGQWARFVDGAAGREVPMAWTISPSGPTYPGSLGWRTTPLTITGQAPGVYTLTATTVPPEKPATASISVEFTIPPLTLAVSPQNTVAVVGTGRVPFTWSAVDGAGRTYNLVWESSNPAVALHAGTDGANVVFFRPMSPGQATLTGRAGSQTITATMKVVNPVTSVVITPATLQAVQGAAPVPFTATAHMTDGTTDASLPAAWVSSNPTVASVDGAGLVTPREPGTVVITATIQGISAAAPVGVAPSPIASVEIQGQPLVLPPGGSAFVGLVALDARGMVPYTGPLRTAALSWTPASVAGVTGDHSGATITGAAEGTGSVSVAWETATDALSVTVRRRLASVTVAPAETVIPPETDPATVAPIQLAATLTDDAGQIVDATADPFKARAVNWTSSDPAVASVDGNGLVTLLKGSREPLVITATVVDSFSDGTSSQLSGTASIIPPLPACEFPGKGKGVKDAVKDRFCVIHPDGPGKSAGKGNAGG